MVLPPAPARSVLQRPRIPPYTRAVMATALACTQPTPCAAVLRCCLRALVLGAAALSAVPADAQSFSAGGFTFTTPHGWQRQTVSSSMRAAQFRIPGDASGDGALAIFYLFRAGAGALKILSSGRQCAVRFKCDLEREPSLIQRGYSSAFTFRIR